MDAASALFADCRRKQAQNFCAYLNKHRSRIVNYEYFQAEQLSKGWLRSSWVSCQTAWQKTENFRSAMETRKCQSNASTPQRLPQWSTGCLMFLQKWDAPLYRLLLRISFKEDVSLSVVPLFSSSSGINSTTKRKRIVPVIHVLPGSSTLALSPFLIISWGESRPSKALASLSKNSLVEVKEFNSGLLQHLRLLWGTLG